MAFWWWNQEWVHSHFCGGCGRGCARGCRCCAGFCLDFHHPLATPNLPRLLSHSTATLVLRLRRYHSYLDAKSTALQSFEIILWRTDSERKWKMQTRNVFFKKNRTSSNIPKYKHEIKSLLAAKGQHESTYKNTENIFAQRVLTWKGSNCQYCQWKFCPNGPRQNVDPTLSDCGLWKGSHPICYPQIHPIP